MSAEALPGRQRVRGLRPPAPPVEGSGTRCSRRVRNWPGSGGSVFIIPRSPAFPPGSPNPRSVSGGGFGRFQGFRGASRPQAFSDQSARWVPPLSELSRLFWDLGEGTGVWRGGGGPLSGGRGLGGWAFTPPSLPRFRRCPPSATWSQLTRGVSPRLLLGCRAARGSWGFSQGFDLR